MTVISAEVQVSYYTVPFPHLAPLNRSTWIIFSIRSAISCIWSPWIVKCNLSAMQISFAWIHSAAFESMYRA